MVYAIRYQISFCNYRRDHNQQIRKLFLGAQEKQISLIYSPQTFESHMLLLPLLVLKAAMIYYPKHIATNWKHGLKMSPTWPFRNYHMNTNIYFMDSTAADQVIYFEKYSLNYYSTIPIT